ncbi:MAG: helix-turn-helix domain-containing protein [Beijerinckiaceae bacterium]
MAAVNGHLSVKELEDRYAGCGDITASRHFQTIWLLAGGHTISQVAAAAAFGERWIEQLLARYSAGGPEALGDLRRRNGASATILKPGLLEKLRNRLAGWHSAAGLKIPHGIRLVYLPPHSPELPPAETLWAPAGEPIVNKHIATLEELGAKIAHQCVTLAEQPEQIKTRTGFHWRPKPINPH